VELAGSLLALGDELETEDGRWFGRAIIALQTCTLAA